MHKLLATLLPASAERAVPKRRPPKARLAVERLEDRLVPSAPEPCHIWLDSSGGGTALAIQGTNLGDSATVQINAKGQIVVSLECGSGEHHEATFAPGKTKIDSIIFAGLDGNDKFVNNTAITSLAYGGRGSDVLVGGQGHDELYGEWWTFGEGTVGEDDKLDGRGGDDDLFGGGGNDILYGGDGEDELWGEAGADYLDGGNHDDYLYGGSGMDKLFGRGGADYLSGGADGIADELWGGPGADRFKKDMVYSPAYPGATWGLWWNVDWPKDFNTAEMDSYV